MARARDVAARRAVPCCSAARHGARCTRGSANRSAKLSARFVAVYVVQKSEGLADKTAEKFKAIGGRFSSPRLTRTAS